MTYRVKREFTALEREMLVQLKVDEPVLNNVHGIDAVYAIAAYNVIVNRLEGEWVDRFRRAYYALRNNKVSRLTKEWDAYVSQKD